MQAVGWLKAPQVQRLKPLHEDPGFKRWFQLGACTILHPYSVVESKLHQVELDSIQDYVAESDNLIALHEQIQGCDGILETMESLLSGFQHDLGQISSEIKSLQEQSLGKAPPQPAL